MLRKILTPLTIMYLLCNQAVFCGQGWSQQNSSDEFSLGNFRILSNDPMRLITNSLDIRSLARLERTSKGLQKRVQHVAFYTKEEGKTKVTWNDVKRTQIPHEENIPWPHCFEARINLVEACIAAAQKNTEQARVLLDLACEMYDRDAIKLKMNMVEIGRLDYIANPKATRDLNEVLVKLGDEEALLRKIDGLYEGEHGYSKNRREALRLNEILVSRGNKQAFTNKVNVLCETDPKAATNLIESHFTYEDREAIQKSGLGPYKVKKGIYTLSCFTQEYKIENGIYTLKPNSALYKSIQQKERFAIHLMIEGAFIGGNGYTKSPKIAVELNEYLVKQGDREAIHKKVYWLTQGTTDKLKRCGLTPDSKEAIVLNERLIIAGDKTAIANKINWLCRGNGTSWLDRKDAGFSEPHGLKKDPAAARAIIETLVKQGDRQAMLQKLQGLYEGKFGYSKNHEEVFKLMRVWLMPYWMPY